MLTLFWISLQVCSVLIQKSGNVAKSLVAEAAEKIFFKVGNLI